MYHRHTHVPGVMKKQEDVIHFLKYCGWIHLYNIDTYILASQQVPSPVSGLLF